MDLTKDEQITLDAYNTNAKAWSDDHDDVEFWKENLKYSTNYFPAGK